MLFCLSVSPLPVSLSLCSLSPSIQAPYLPFSLPHSLTVSVTQSHRSLSQSHSLPAPCLPFLVSQLPVSLSPSHSTPSIPTPCLPAQILMSPCLQVTVKVGPTRGNCTPSTVAKLEQERVDGMVSVNLKRNLPLALVICLINLPCLAFVERRWDDYVP